MTDYNIYEISSLGEELKDAFPGCKIGKAVYNHNFTYVFYTDELVENCSYPNIVGLLVDNFLFVDKEFKIKPSSTWKRIQRTEGLESYLGLYH